MTYFKAFDKHFAWMGKLPALLGGCRTVYCRMHLSWENLSCCNVCRDCTEICSLCIKFKAQQSTFFEQLCLVCADICEACAKKNARNIPKKVPGVKIVPRPAEYVLKRAGKQ